MKRIVIAAVIFALAAVAAIAVSSAATGAFHQGQQGVAAAGTCDTKNCPPTAHCCYSCTGSPICVKNGVPCPECAPQ